MPARDLGCTASVQRDMCHRSVPLKHPKGTHLDYSDPLQSSRSLPLLSADVRSSSLCWGPLTQTWLHSAHTREVWRGAALGQLLC